MSVVGRDKSKDSISERGHINARIGRVSFAKSLVGTALNARFPEIDFNVPVKPAITEAAPVVTERQPQPAATGASAVSYAMNAAHEQLRTEADRNVARAFAEPGPATLTTVPSQNLGRAQAAAEAALTPEQIQHISSAQNMVERAYNEPTA